VRGLQKNMSYELLRVNVMVSGKNLRGQSGFHVDTLDLYSARQRTVFIKQAAAELHAKEEIIHDELGHVLRKLAQGRRSRISCAPRRTRKRVVSVRGRGGCAGGARGRVKAKKSQQ
jgi:hypothetical protein